MKYRIKEKCWGAFGRTSYEFEAGETEPTNAREAQVLEYLVEIGRAGPVEVAKPKKKET